MRCTKLKTSLWAALPLPLLWSCSGQAIDVGSNGEAGARTTAGGNAGGTGTGAGQGPGGVSGTGSARATAVGTPTANPGTLTSWPDLTECGADGGIPFEGAWTGYAQGQGNEDNFTLELTGTSEAPCGTLTFGEPRAYPPATDAAVPYPPSFNLENLWRAPGFAYTLLGIAVDGPRVQFHVAYSEPYASWCRLQTSYPHADLQGYRCLPSDFAYNPGERCGGGTSAASAKCHHEACLGTFNPPCACDESRCIADIDAAGETFDLRFDDTEARGEMSTKTVFLERQ
jgi:hypothetical protein